MRTEKSDIYGEITNQIIEAMEAGADNYQMPWHVNGADSVLPVSASTHRRYRGVNVMMLWAVAAKNGYATSLWATYQQWRDLGAQVRKGEKSTSVVFWKFFDEEDEGEASEGNERSNHKGVMARAYHVFNAAQVDGYEILPFRIFPKRSGSNARSNSSAAYMPIFGKVDREPSIHRQKITFRCLRLRPSKRPISGTRF